MSYTRKERTAIANRVQSLKPNTKIERAAIKRALAAYVGFTPAPDQEPQS